MQAAKLAGPATLAAAGALLFVGLFFGDGISNGRLFWIGSLVLIPVIVLVAPAPAPVPRGHGVAFLALLVLLRAWVGLTIRWSIAPDQSWAAFDRIAVYGAFAFLGLLATRVPRPARTIGAGLALLLGLVLLWALAGKVVPALFPDGARVARLRNPIGYWYALGLAADLALPLFLCVARRRRDVAALGVYLATIT